MLVQYCRHFANIPNNIHSIKCIQFICVQTYRSNRILVYTNETTVSNVKCVYVNMDNSKCY